MGNQIRGKTGVLGTFSGVFTPSILTILGIILFLRLGHVLGNAGLRKAFIIIGIANLISILTTFSLAAIATNMKVKRGGDYYLISRTLGVEFGGAIGIVLFIAQSVSIAFYCIGFGEVVSGLSPLYGMVFEPQIIASAALLFLFILAWLGADWAIKFQYLVMAILVVSLISFYAGGIELWDTGLLKKNWHSEPGRVDFWILFAIFFPAVTGFTQGVSMSGDLKDAGKSLPTGTFLAVGLSIGVYLTVLVIFAATTPLETLATDYGVMKKTARFGVFIDAGVIAATLSSAMASFLGAPRILQSLAADKIIPPLNRFAKGVGPSGNPRKGVLFSLVIAGATIALGQLDLIARIVSMFFLISYGLLNYATYFEAATLSPSFRPRFKFYDRRLSLAGFIACLGVILAIDFKTGVAAAAILFAVYQYVKRTSGPNRWADSKRSYHLQRVRANLIAANEDLEHPREWRPCILALSDTSNHRAPLMEFAALIEGGSGITAAVSLIRGHGLMTKKLKETAQKKLELELAENSNPAFALVVSALDTEAGLSTLFQSFGIGPVRANTILLNWMETVKDTAGKQKSPDMNNYMEIALESDCNLILLNLQDRNKPGKTQDHKASKRIDVWWKNDDTSRFMLLLSYLITRNKAWDSAEIRLLAVNYHEDSQHNRDRISTILADIRIDATALIMINADNQTVIKESKDADLVFLPMDIKNNVPLLFSGDSVEPVLNEIKMCALAVAAEKIDLDAEPEEGKANELADIYDQLRHAEKRAALAQKYAVKTAEAAREQMKQLTTSNKKGLDSDLKQKVEEALEIREKAIAAQKRAAREKTRLAQAENRADFHGISREK